MSKTTFLSDYNILLEGSEASQAYLARTLPLALDWAQVERTAAFDLKVAKGDFCQTYKDFCKGNLGISRTKMPQLRESVAEKFARSLAQLGIRVKRTRIDVSHLKATQKEINADKAEGIAEATVSGKFDPTKDPVIVSREGYILDGHHRWAAALVATLKDGIRRAMSTIQIDLPIRELLQRAVNFDGVAFAGFDEGNHKSAHLFDHRGSTMHRRIQAGKADLQGQNPKDRLQIKDLDEGESWTTTLGEFVRDNEGDDDTIQEVLALGKGQKTRAGGGAGGLMEIKRIDKKASINYQVEKEMAQAVAKALQGTVEHTSATTPVVKLEEGLVVRIEKNVGDDQWAATIRRLSKDRNEWGFKDTLHETEKFWLWEPAPSDVAKWVKSEMKRNKMARYEVGLDRIDKKASSFREDRERREQASAQLRVKRQNDMAQAMKHLSKPKSHPLVDLDVKSIGNGLAYQVTVPDRLQLLDLPKPTDPITFVRNMLRFMGLNNPLDTGFTIQDRAEGDGVTLLDWESSLDKKWRRIWTKPLSQKEIDKFEKAAHTLSDRDNTMRHRIQSNNSDFQSQKKHVGGGLGEVMKTERINKKARYEEGKPADPTENMSEEDAREWRENTEEYGDKFKEAMIKEFEASYFGLDRIDKKASSFREDRERREQASAQLRVKRQNDMAQAMKHLSKPKSHPIVDLEVKSIGNGLAYQVTVPDRLQLLDLPKPTDPITFVRNMLRFMGLNNPLDTGFTIQDRAEGDGVTLLDWESSLDKKWRRIWTKPLSQKELDKFEKAAYSGV